MAGLQIPSMTYPPSSTVSHFNQIYCVSTLSDWLIPDGVFFVIRRITSLNKKKVKQIKELFGGVVQSIEALEDI